MIKSYFHKLGQLCTLHMLRLWRSHACIGCCDSGYPAIEPLRRRTQGQSWLWKSLDFGTLTRWKPQYAFQSPNIRLAETKANLFSNWHSSWGQSTPRQTALRVGEPIEQSPGAKRNWCWPGYRHDPTDSNWFQLIEPFKTSSTAWRCFKTNSSTWPRLQGRSCSGFYRWESGGVRYLVSDVSVYWIVLARFFVFSWCITSLITWIIHLLIACLIGCLIDKLMDWLAGWVSKRVLQMLSTGNTTQQTKNYQNLLHVTCYDKGLENTVANLRRTSPEPFNSGLQRTDTVEWLNRGDWVPGQGFCCTMVNLFVLPSKGSCLYNLIYMS